MDVKPVSVTGVAATPSPQASPEKTAAAARDFEALLVSELLRASHMSGSAAWLGGEDSTADSAFGLAEEQFARALAQGGGLGIARLVIKGLDSTHSSSAKPARKQA